MINVRLPPRYSSSSRSSTRSRQLGLGGAFGCDAEPLRDQAQHVVALDLCGHDLQRIEARTVDLGQQVAPPSGFARADLAGDGDEALRLRQAIAEISHCLAMRAAGEPEARVRRQLERGT
jgi:hypothetical protein